MALGFIPPQENVKVPANIAPFPGRDSLFVRKYPGVCRKTIITICFAIQAHRTHILGMADYLKVWLPLAPAIDRWENEGGAPDPMQSKVTRNGFTTWFAIWFVAPIVIPVFLLLLIAARAVYFAYS